MGEASRLAARWKLNEHIRYWSESYKQWIECTVDAVNGDGAVQVSCKPGYWMPPEEQAHKLSAGGASAASSTPPAGAGRGTTGAPSNNRTTTAPYGGGRGYSTTVPKAPDRRVTTVADEGSAPTTEQMAKIREILDSKAKTSKRSLLEFRRFDTNGDGQLQVDEMQQCLETLKKELGIPSIHSSQIQMLIKKFDYDGNGTLDPQEFEDFFHRVLVKSRQCFEEFKVKTEFFVEKQSGSPFAVYKVIKQLGEGAFGITHLVEDQRSKQSRVLKTINKKKANMPPEELEQEIKSLRMLDHPHIIKLFEYYEDHVDIYLAMEIAEGGELLKVIEDLFDKGWRVNERWSATVMQQVLEAMAYCHGRKLIHKDIKAENIMLLRSTEAKTHPHAVIIDLGLAEMFSTASAEPGQAGQAPRPSLVVTGDQGVARESELYKALQSKKVGGTPTTMAPEVWRAYMGRGSFGMKCDVYSLGVVLFQLLTGELPFMHRSIEPTEWLTKIKRGPPMDLLKGCSEESQKLVCQMLEYNDIERPTARQALGSSWFTEKAQQVDVALSEKQMAALFSFEKKNELQKAVTLQVAAQLRAADLPKINAIFRKYDADDSGCLETEELEKALEEMGCDAETAAKAAKAIDLDKNGLIEYTEFVAGCISLFDDRHEAYLWQIFTKMDKEGRGYLSHKDFEDLLMEGHKHGLGFSPSRSEVAKYIEDMDTDHSGTIKFEEFVRYLSPHAKNSS